MAIKPLPSGTIETGFSLFGFALDLNKRERIKHAFLVASLGTGVLGFGLGFCLLVLSPLFWLSIAVMSVGLVMSAVSGTAVMMQKQIETKPLDYFQAQSDFAESPSSYNVEAYNESDLFPEPEPETGLLRDDASLDQSETPLMSMR